MPRIYEILIRGRSDGTVDPAAAHLIEWVEDGLDRDGEARWALGPPRPIAVADVSGLLTSDAAGLLNAATEAAAARSVAEAAVATITAERDALVAKVEEMSAAAAAVSPDTISAFQVRAVLIEDGLIDTVEAAVAAAGPIIRAAWEYGTVFDRGSPTIAVIAAALAPTRLALDALFRRAAQIRA